MTDISYRTFFIDSPVEEFDNVEKYVADRFEFYFIAHEQFNRKMEEKPHFHFLLKCTQKQLNACTKYFVEKYKLRNNSGTRGGKRLWGAPKKPIHSEDKFMTYLAKDGNIRSTLPTEVIRDYIDKSFKKEEKSMYQHKLYEYLDSVHGESDFIIDNSDYDFYEKLYNKIKLNIILYHIYNGIKLSPQYKSIIINYIRVSEKCSNKESYRLRILGKLIK
jgi:hypothetical protein